MVLGPPLPLGRKMEKGPPHPGAPASSAGHKSSMEDSAQALSLSLFWETFFYFFFFFFLLEMSLLGMNVNWFILKL